MLMSALKPLADLENHGEFIDRHIGIDAEAETAMLATIGATSRQALIEAVVPRSIARAEPMRLPPPVTEAMALEELAAIAAKNTVLKSCIGQGYHGTFTPTVILRNVLENPAWYTAYTPYQAEISQGRLEALVNFQTMVSDLTGMDIANASMLDEATAVAEAMTLARRSTKHPSHTFVVAGDAHPQTIAVLRTRAEPLGIAIALANSGPEWDRLLEGQDYFAAFAQWPATSGQLHDMSQDAPRIHAAGALFVVAADLLALALVASPGELGADIACGTTQRFGMPMGCGGPHAGYLACKDALKRGLPGRLVGVSIDSRGNPAYRLALQTREQHIRREKATSNICTAQVLPAVVASMYAVYHGPDGLKRIASRVAAYTAILAEGLEDMGWTVRGGTAFDAVTIDTGAETAHVFEAAAAAGYNLRRFPEWGDTMLGIAFDETTVRDDIAALWRVFADAKGGAATIPDIGRFERGIEPRIPHGMRRATPFLTHPTFHRFRSETSMLRYLRRLSDKDLALDRTMIPLGSCTMKLNATSEMIPITWPGFANIHPFAPAAQRAGYTELAAQLERWLCETTGYAGASLQPNAGSQGEYAGLLAIRAWHASRGDSARTVCLIPESAHGTNPASAQMVGMQVVVVACDAEGNVDLADLEAKCRAHAERLSCVMITYPSTYGVFDPQVKELCAIVHRHGGRVYVDGANMNALVGVAAPGHFGGDVSHLNLHKTFCIPHGGGGPGVGPVCVVPDLVPFLPSNGAEDFVRDTLAGTPRGGGVGAVSAAPLGNAGVLPISWMYIRMMGAEGLRRATETAILSANYVAARLADAYDIHFSGGIASIRGGGVAHECILDLRPLKESSGVTAEDVAKRLIDHGFHAPTLSFPVPGTLMVEPTESESLEELDRFCEAMLAIRGEIAKVERGEWPREDNPLKQAPHTAARSWSPVGRVDNVWGDRNLSCSCPPLSAYAP